MTQPPPDSGPSPFDPQFPPAQAPPPPPIPQGPYAAPPPPMAPGPYGAPPMGPGPYGVPPMGPGPYAAPPPGVPRKSNAGKTVAIVILTVIGGSALLMIVLAGVCLSQL